MYPKQEILYIDERHLRLIYTQCRLNVTFMRDRGLGLLLASFFQPSELPSGLNTLPRCSRCCRVLFFTTRLLATRGQEYDDGDEAFLIFFYFIY